MDHTTHHITVDTILHITVDTTLRITVDTILRITVDTTLRDLTGHVHLFTIHHVDLVHLSITLRIEDLETRIDQVEGMVVTTDQLTPLQLNVTLSIDVRTSVTYVVKLSTLGLSTKSLTHHVREDADTK